MHALSSLLIGYLLGSISPAAILSIIKHRNLHEEGTGNLGATNTMLVLGKNCGILVMVVDILKSFFAAKLARLLFPQLAVAAMLAGFGAVLGHIHSVFLRFHGGKGVAALAGLIIAYDPRVFLILFGLAFLLMMACNYGVAGPVSAGLLFPVFVWAGSRDLLTALIAAGAGLLVIYAHRINFVRIRTQQERLFRPFVLARLHSDR